MRDTMDAVIAIANPVEGDVVKMTNHHWQFSIDARAAAPRAPIDAVTLTAPRHAHA